MRDTADKLTAATRRSITRLRGRAGHIPEGGIQRRADYTAQGGWTDYTTRSEGHTTEGGLHGTWGADYITRSEGHTTEKGHTAHGARTIQHGAREKQRKGGYTTHGGRTIQRGARDQQRREGHTARQMEYTTGSEERETASRPYNSQAVLAARDSIDKSSDKRRMQTGRSIFLSGLW